MTGQRIVAGLVVLFIPACAVLVAVLLRRLTDLIRRRRRLDRIGLAPPPGAPWWQRRRRIVIFLVGCGAGLASLALAGPVGCIVAGAYGALAARALLNRSAGRARALRHARALDALSTLAADLRAGCAPATALATALPVWTPCGTSPNRTAPRGTATSRAISGSGGLLAAPAAADGAEVVVARVAAAWRVAETAGAPMADLLDRLDADLRTAARVRVSAAAQAAGVRATAVLLAVLPAGGLALGYGIGVDPLRVLLHTPLGAICALSALLLQLLGLAWSDRLARTVQWRA